MAHRLVKILTLLSLLTAVALAGLWITTRGFCVSLSYARFARAKVLVEMHRGGLQITKIWGWVSDEPIRCKAEPAPTHHFVTFASSTEVATWRTIRFPLSAGEWTGGTCGALHEGIKVLCAGHPVTTIRLGWPALFFVALFVPSLVVFRRIYDRIKQGLRNRGDPEAIPCPDCGYDLRASAERCPECGCAVEWEEEQEVRPAVENRKEDRNGGPAIVLLVLVVFLVGIISATKLLLITESDRLGPGELAHIFVLRRLELEFGNMSRRPVISMRGPGSTEWQSVFDGGIQTKDVFEFVDVRTEAELSDPANLAELKDKFARALSIHNGKLMLVIVRYPSPSEVAQEVISAFAGNERVQVRTYEITELESAARNNRPAATSGL